MRDFPFGVMEMQAGVSEMEIEWGFLHPTVGLGRLVVVVSFLPEQPCPAVYQQAVVVVPCQVGVEIPYLVAGLPYPEQLAAAVAAAVIVAASVVIVFAVVVVFDPSEVSAGILISAQDPYW